MLGGIVMIEEQFVSFETAKLLKEAGFDEVCRCDYDSLGGFCWFRTGKSIPKGWVPRPSQALAARWLREVHRIVVDATFIPPSTYRDAWQYFIGNMDDMVWDGDYEPSNQKYTTYEAALEAGLQEAIKMIKK